MDKSYELATLGVRAGQVRSQFNEHSEALFLTSSFETSCFDGVYITGDVTSDYLRDIEIQRDAKRDSADDENAQLDLNLAA